MNDKEKKLKPRSYHALIVEDEKSVRNIVREYLAETNLFSTIIEAEDGPMAMKKANLQRFDVIIVDLVMPGLDGIALIKKIQENYPKMGPKWPIIILSGNVDSYAVEDAVDLGIKHILTKPLDMEKFELKIKSILTPKA